MAENVEAVQVKLEELVLASVEAFETSRLLSTQRRKVEEVQEELAALIKLSYRDELCLTAVSELTISFAWGCSASPINGCVYDVSQDPCEDSCLFCGDPHERK